jgi:hypothetical protein
MKNKYLTLLMLSAFLNACTQETMVNPSPRLAKGYANLPNMHTAFQQDNPTADPDNFAKAFVKPVSVNGAITYHSIYGGLDFNFGASFPYPTTINSYENYAMYVPSIGSVQAAPLYEFKMGPDGSAFTAAFVTINSPLPANGHTALSNYYKAFDDFISQKINPQTGSPKQPILPDFSTFANAAGYTPATNGMIIIKGRFVKDNTSPTNVLSLT